MNTILRLHPMERHKAFKAMEQDVALCILEARMRGGWDGRTFDRARVAFEYHFPDRRVRDPDNHIAGLKPATDAMVRAGLLAADDFDHLELLIRKGEPDKHNPRVVAHIEELPA